MFTVKRFYTGLEVCAFTSRSFNIFGIWFVYLTQHLGHVVGGPPAVE